jgi:hypothetical protein
MRIDSLGEVAFATANPYEKYMAMVINFEYE